MDNVMSSVVSIFDYMEKEPEEIRLAEDQIFYNTNEKISLNMAKLCCDDPLEVAKIAEKIDRLEKRNKHLQELIDEHRGK